MEIESIRQKPKLVHNGKLYNYDRMDATGTKKFWRCENKQICMARLHTDLNDMVLKEVNAVHTCDTDETKIERKKIVTAVKKRAIDSINMEDPVTNSAQIFEKVPTSLLANSPSTNAIKKIVNRIHRKYNGPFAATCANNIHEMGLSKNSSMCHSGNAYSAAQPDASALLGMQIAATHRKFTTKYGDAFALEFQELLMSDMFAFERRALQMSSASSAENMATATNYSSSSSFSNHNGLGSFEQH